MNDEALARLARIGAWVVNRRALGGLPSGDFGVGYLDAIDDAIEAGGVEPGHARNCDDWHHPVTGHCGDCGCFTCSPER